MVLGDIDLTSPDVYINLTLGSFQGVCRQR